VEPFSGSLLWNPSLQNALLPHSKKSYSVSEGHSETRVSVSMCARGTSFELRHRHMSWVVPFSSFGKTLVFISNYATSRLVPQLGGNPVCGTYSFVVIEVEQTNWSPAASHSDVAVWFRTNYRSAFRFLVKQSVNFTLQDQNTRSFETSASKTSKTWRHFPGDWKLCQKMVGSFVGINFHDHPVVYAVGVRLLEHPADR